MWLWVEALTIKVWQGGCKGCGWSCLADSEAEIDAALKLHRDICIKGVRATP